MKAPHHTAIIAAITVALTATLCAGCNTTGCTDNQNSLPLARLYSSSTGQAITISGLQVTGIDAPGDSTLYAPSLTLSELYLPLRSTTDTTAYCFHYEQEGINNTATNDTITFRYTSWPYFASEECGAMYRYHIQSLTYTRHIIDSIALLDATITNADTERIRIYLRTAPTTPAQP